MADAGDISGLRDALLATAGGLATAALAGLGALKGGQRVLVRLSGNNHKPNDEHLRLLREIKVAIQSGNARLDSMDGKLGTMNGGLERMLGRTDPRV